MTTLVVSLYLLSLTGLLLFGIHRLKISVDYGRTRFRRRRVPGMCRRVPGAESAPLVCIQCPLYNEPAVVESLLESVTAIRWPADRLEIQILDDSTDGTPEIVERWLRENPALAVRCRHLRRADRSGFKAGALQAGLAQTGAPFLAVFDADFRPEPDFLERLMPRFDAPDVAVVQARWEFVNRRSSLLTRLQAVFLDAHFVVEQAARFGEDLFFNFNGTAGIWRRTALEDAGSWSADTVTEDLDLSYRAQLRGWRFVYDSEYAVPSELPGNLTAFKSQQRRWTKGGIQVFRKLAGRVLRSRQPIRVKVEAFFHLGIGFVHLFLVLFTAMLVPCLLIAGTAPLFRAGWVSPAALLAVTVATVAFFTAGQYFRERDGRELLLTVVMAPLVLAFGLAMSVTCLSAVVEGLFLDGGEFVRTPKGSAVGRCPDRRRRSKTETVLWLVALAELGLGGVLGFGGLHFLLRANFGVAVSLLLKSGTFFVLAAAFLRDSLPSTVRTRLQID